jgi:hypothetical protein
VRLDLDPANLGEVRRRVVEPVVAALLRPGELSAIQVEFWGPRESGDALEVWATVEAQDDRVQARLCKATFEWWDAREVAADLAFEIEDWLPQTSFAWGQRREVKLAHVAIMAPRSGKTTTYGVVIPGRPAPPGVRVLDVFPDEDEPSPVWEEGVNLPLSDLQVPAELSASLLAWRDRWDAETSRLSSWSWDEVVMSLDPKRRALIRRLREVLGPTFLVTEPAPLLADR